jgi:hypothetical protein
MTKRKLRLVKKSKPKVLESQQPSALSSAEIAEATRFREMTAARAARRAMIHRIMSEVADLDEVSPAA